MTLPLCSVLCRQVHVPVADVITRIRIRTESPNSLFSTLIDQFAALDRKWACYVLFLSKSLALISVVVF